jgi:hypothetical protein
MRPLVAVVALSLLCSHVPSARALPSNVVFELGGAYQRLGGSSEERVGGGGFAGVLVPVSTWLNVGGEAGLGVLGAPQGWTMYASDGAGTDDERSSLATLMLAVRLSPTVPRGLAPFLMSRSGVARLHLGAMHSSSAWYSGVSTQRAVDQYVFCGAIGVGLRGTWPRPAPGFELGLHLLMLGGETPRTLFEPRLALTY